MLSQLHLEDFKSFDYEKIRFGSLTVLFGANATGKSNIRDALRFLHASGRGYSLAECLNGKYNAGVNEWEGIRGGSQEIIRKGERLSLAEKPRILPEGHSGTGSGVRAFWRRHEDRYTAYSIAFKSSPYMRMLSEVFHDQGETIFATFPNVEKSPYGAESTATIGLGEGDSCRFLYIPNDRPSLSTVLGEAKTSESERELIKELLTLLSGLRFLDPSPNRMRDYVSTVYSNMGDHGEHLSAAIYQMLHKDVHEKQVFLDWLTELTPTDIEDLDFYKAETGEVLLKIIEPGGREISARSASDGTLRYLALVTALMTAEENQVFFIEEIDNGIHPTRLHLLVQMLEEMTAGGRTQVIATTHSPHVLAYLNEESRKHALYCYREEEYGTTHVKPIMEIDGIEKALEADSLQNLLATGWMEHVL